MSAPIHVVSISGGKDSTATALLALKTQPPETVQFVFADTGNEHELTYEYIDYLEGVFGRPVVRLRRDFSAWWEHRRQWVDTKGREKYGDAAAERVLEVFNQGPSGNPYLDLCMIKGRFPSRRAQFCTQFLKTEPLLEYQIGLADEGAAVWSWQGVRAEESPGRARLPSFQMMDPDGLLHDAPYGRLFVNRPILRWTAADTFEAMRAAGVKSNPLYRMGMGRVGCMPCINAAKNEVREIAARFPEHIDRIEAWERLVATASWRQLASFFPAPTGDNRGALRGSNIRSVVQWSKTSRGGTQYDMTSLMADSAGCASAYGLCE
jgi:3'-phosphoadenosine 5'-phosphosulfate sulfotransferase (PAPS reductase)/FAD synthetase